MKELGRFVLKRTRLYSLYLAYRRRDQLKTIHMELLRCQERPFSELQGFSGKPIQHFPPTRFFRLYLSEPYRAQCAFADWLRTCLLEMEAWQVDKKQGGWADGSLMKTIYTVHQEHGIDLQQFENADRDLINEAIDRRVHYYFNVLNSIKEKGYDRLCKPPVRCLRRGDLYVLHDGHHRTAALNALGYQSIYAKVIGEQS